MGERTGNHRGGGPAVVVESMGRFAGGGAEQRPPWHELIVALWAKLEFLALRMNIGPWLRKLH